MSRTTGRVVTGAQRQTLGPAPLLFPCAMQSAVSFLSWLHGETSLCGVLCMANLGLPLGTPDGADQSCCAVPPCPWLVGGLWVLEKRCHADKAGRLGLLVSMALSPESRLGGQLECSALH